MLNRPVRYIVLYLTLIVVGVFGVILFSPLSERVIVFYAVVAEIGVFGLLYTIVRLIMRK